MGWFETLAKYSLFIFNIIFLIGGIVLLVVGIFDKLEINAYRTVIPENYQNIELVPIITIVIGSVTIFVSFIGCYGALKENWYSLCVFILLLMVILLFQIVLGIIVFVTVADKRTLDVETEQSLTKLFGKYESDKSYVSKDMVDQMQSDLKCCGVTGTSYWNTNGSSIPESCIDETTQAAYDVGCTKAFREYLTKSVRLIGIVVFVITVIEIIALILTLYLSNVFRRRGSEYSFDQY